jgi:hypothetical protein
MPYNNKLSRMTIDGLHKCVEQFCRDAIKFVGTKCSEKVSFQHLSVKLKYWIVIDKNFGQMR